MGGGDAPEVRDVGDGAHGEAAVDEAVVDEHVRHPEQRDSEPLQCPNTGTCTRQGATRHHHSDPCPHSLCRQIEQEKKKAPMWVLGVTVDA